jgi:orotidine-5'-phosphate decarboxylase
MVEDAQTFNASLLEGADEVTAATASNGAGPVGVVLGATLNLADFDIDVTLPVSQPVLPVLAPGFGAQGGRIEDAKAIFGSLGWALLANESRGILAGGETGLAQRIRTRSDVLAAAL